MPSKSTIIPSLKPKLAVCIAAKVATHRYLSASEVVWAALRLLEGQDRQGEHKRQNSVENEHDAR